MGANVLKPDKDTQIKALQDALLTSVEISTELYNTVKELAKENARLKAELDKCNKLHEMHGNLE